MKILIDGNELSDLEIVKWKMKHIKQAFSNLKRPIPMENDVDKLESELNRLKNSMSYEERIKPIKWKLAIGNIGMKLATILSFGKRKCAITTLYEDGISVEKLGRAIDDYMSNDTPENRRINLSVCPEHYALVSRGETLEVVEKTGCSPVPTRFYITFNDETGIITPRDENYPYQSVGIAKLANGMIIGGVRHQFKNTKTGIEARTVVEFPSLCPNVIVKDHQKHLAVEWSGWIKQAKQDIN